MKNKNRVCMLFVLIVTGYLVYKKTKVLNDFDNSINECKKQIFQKGYKIKDSWSYNVPKNTYLEFGFSDYENMNYEVIFNKFKNSLVYIKKINKN